mmetsp:Transcript_10796/g.37615  ORF Transcript_10796/g.37615 Transcript_10796/m.37615 type:complete len:308 (-) Transcript_10796:32-955(-)
MEFPVDPATFSMRGLLDKMNASMRATGASVHLKKKVAEGVYVDAKEDDDTSNVDLQVKLAAATNAVKGKSHAERLAFAVARKEAANALYREGAYVRAGDTYLEALVGLDFGDSEEEKREAVQTVQIPVLCNLAACKLAMGEAPAVVVLCDKAIEVDPTCVKAWLRRCRAHADLERMAEAKADLARAAELATSEADVALVKRGRKQLQRDIAALREHRERERAMWAKVADADVYDDMPSHEEREAMAAAAKAAKAAIPDLGDDTSEDEEGGGGDGGGVCSRLLDCLDGLLFDGSRARLRQRRQKAKAE